MDLFLISARQLAPFSRFSHEHFKEGFCNIWHAVLHTLYVILTSLRSYKNKYLCALSNPLYIHNLYYLIQLCKMITIYKKKLSWCKAEYNTGFFTYSLKQHCNLILFMTVSYHASDNTKELPTPFMLNINYYTKIYLV